MNCLTLLLVNIFVVASAFSKNVGHRDARFIRGTYTATVVETSTVTSLVPSSCVQVDATLPPCRGIRFLNFPQFIRNQSYFQPQPYAKSDSPLETTPLGWGEYFGIYLPTVTVTQTQIVQTVVADPRIVVTYAVKGCKPMHLPMDLDRCPGGTQAPRISQALPTSTVTPTPSATVPVSTPRNTKVIDVMEGASYTVAEVNEIQMNGQLESSQENLENFKEERQDRATEPLPY